MGYAFCSGKKAHKVRVEFGISQRLGGGGR